MDARTKREADEMADDFAADVAEFVEYLRGERGNEAAEEFLSHVMARINEIQLPANRRQPLPGEVLASVLVS